MTSKRTFRTFPSFRAFLTATALAAGLLCGTAQASGQDDMQAASAAGNYARVLELARPLAEKGDAKAQYNLGVLYRDGKGVEKNDQTAYQWFEKAAKQGDAKAQYQMGEKYFLEYLGLGDSFDQLFGVASAVPSKEAEESRYRNWVTARQWYEKAAQQGHVDALYRLGTLHINTPQRVEPDYQTARQWFEKAAATGNAAAQRALGEMYHYGYGVTKNYQTARQWYEKAAAKGEASAQRALGEMYRDGKGVEKNYQTARQWFEKAAAQDYFSAKEELKKLRATGQ